MKLEIEEENYIGFCKVLGFDVEWNGGLLRFLIRRVLLFDLCFERKMRMELVEGKGRWREISWEVFEITVIWIKVVGRWCEKWLFF